MDEYGRNMAPSQLPHIFENEPFNPYASNYVSAGLTSWSFPHDIPPPTSFTNPILTQQQTTRPRGRPPGSKNKPKPPIFINQESNEAMKPVTIEVATGFDVMEALVKYANLHNVGISVLSVTGSIANVTLHQFIPHSPTLTLNGPFNLVALTGTYVPDPFSSDHRVSTTVTPASFGITLSRPQGEIFGGVVVGKIVASSTVGVTATVFKRPMVYKVGFNDNGEGSAGAGASGGGAGAGAGAGTGAGAGASADVGGVGEGVHHSGTAGGLGNDNMIGGWN